MSVNVKCTKCVDLLVRSDVGIDVKMKFSGAKVVSVDW